MIPKKRTTRQKFFDYMPELENILSKQQINKLIKFVNNDRKAYIDAYINKLSYFKMGSPIFADAFMRSFDDAAKKFLLTTPQVRFLLCCVIVRKHPRNFSGYIYGKLLKTLYGPKFSTRSLKPLAKEELLRNVKDRDYVKKNALTNATQLYEITPEGMNVYHYFNRRFQHYCSQYEMNGGEYFEAIEDFNYSQEYLTALKLFFNAERYAFVEYGFHLTHPEMDLVIPKWKDYVLGIEEEMDLSSEEKINSRAFREIKEMWEGELREDKIRKSYERSQKGKVQSQFK